MPSEQRSSADPEPESGFGDVERVEVAPGFHVELSVPVTSEQLQQLERLAKEHETHVIGAIQIVLREALS